MASHLSMTVSLLAAASWGGGRRQHVGAAEGTRAGSSSGLCGEAQSETTDRVVGTGDHWLTPREHHRTAKHTQGDEVQNFGLKDMIV